MFRKAEPLDKSTSPHASPLLWVVGLVSFAIFVVGLAMDSFWLRMLSKPFPVLCMAAWVWGYRQNNRYALFVFGGLLLSVVGDVFMELAGFSNTWFVSGLVSFLIAHICYIIAYLQDSRKLHPLRSLPFFAFCLGLISFLLLNGKVGRMSIPVVIYATVIGTMMWRAAARYGEPKLTNFSLQMALVGACVFGASDSMIAINKFYAPIPGARYLIIVTYWVGQLGITASVWGRDK